jgi:hypothetical protein
MKSTLMKLTIVTALAIPPSAFADDDRPYYGSDQQPCKVNYPSGKFKELDTGYLTNKDCSKIFVKPPKKFKSVEIGRKIHPEAIALCQQLRLIKNFKEYDVFQAKHTGMFSESTLAIDFTYEDLMDAYRKANPTLNASYHEIPLDVKYLTVKDQENSFYSYSIVRKNNNQSLPYSVQKNVPGYNSPLTFEESNMTSIINDESVEISLKLNLALTCSILEGRNQTTGFISGTMNYYYHLNSTFTQSNQYHPYPQFTSSAVF